MTVGTAVSSVVTVNSATNQTVPHAGVRDARTLTRNSGGQLHIYYRVCNINIEIKKTVKTDGREHGLYIVIACVNHSFDIFILEPSL